MTTRRPVTWRYRLFVLGLVAAGASWLAVAADVLLSLAYGWNQSILLAALNGDSMTKTALLWWACFILIALHARD